MLLINLFKKASVNSLVLRSKQYLMLFLLLINSYFLLFLVSHNYLLAQQRPVGFKLIHLQELRADFIKSNEAEYVIDKQKEELVSRAIKAEQDLILQKKQYQNFFIGLSVFIIGLISYLIYSQIKFSTLQYEKENELQEALAKIKVQDLLHQDRLTMTKDLYDALEKRMSLIIASIDNLQLTFEIKDKKLNDRLTHISDFATTAVTDLLEKSKRSQQEVITET